MEVLRLRKPASSSDIPTGAQALDVDGRRPVLASSWARARPPFGEAYSGLGAVPRGAVQARYRKTLYILGTTDHLARPSLIQQLPEMLRCQTTATPWVVIDTNQ